RRAALLLRLPRAAHHPLGGATVVSVEVKNGAVSEIAVVDFGDASDEPQAACPSQLVVRIRWVAPGTVRFKITGPQPNQNAHSNSSELLHGTAEHCEQSGDNIFWPSLKATYNLICLGFTRSTYRRRLAPAIHISRLERKVHAVRACRRGFCASTFDSASVTCGSSVPMRPRLRTQRSTGVLEFLSAQLEKTAQREHCTGDLNAVMQRSERARFVTPRENNNTNALVDFMDRHDLVSAKKLFRKPLHRLAAFAGFKRPAKALLQEITDAGPDNKPRAVWSVVNRLTGRKRRKALSHVELPEESSFNVSPITIDEVLQLAKKTPGNKATGPDDVPVEVLRIPQVMLEVMRVMKYVLAGGPTWGTAHIVGIPKKPDSAKVEEHRGISLMSCTANLFNRVLLSRLQPVLDPFLRREQNGFRPGRGTVTQILALRRILEEASIHQSTIICIFVDFLKTFDSVSRRVIANILRAYHVPSSW
uniref:Reverse transcriptase domain-containing protein n=2 Tax=Macrostomum lignano TaxID=282301 RepID=A0A1I8JIM6_9PLAT